MPDSVLSGDCKHQPKEAVHVAFDVNNDDNNNNMKNQFGKKQAQCPIDVKLSDKSDVEGDADFT